jgi:hypothetical protein
MVESVKGHRTSAEPRVGYADEGETTESLTEAAEQIEAIREELEYLAESDYPAAWMASALLDAVN